MLLPVDRLRVEASKLFKDVDLDAIEDLIASCQRLEIPRGERLLEAGTSNYRLYLVLHGQLDVYPGGIGLARHTTLVAGDCAGEMSLIDGLPVSALVIASSDCELLAIPHTLLWAMIERSPPVARNLLAILAGRVRHDNLALVAGQTRNLEFELKTRVDPVSGLHNQTWMDSAFPRAIGRCERDGAPACLAVVDIDHFARFNEQLGRSAGDAMVRAVATQLIDGLRTHDLLARRENGKFAMLLAHATTDQGLRVIERLRASVEAMRVKGGAVVPQVTVSFGLAPLGAETSLPKLLAAAEEALQHARQAGGNRIEAARAET